MDVPSTNGSCVRAWIKYIHHVGRKYHSSETLKRFYLQSHSLFIYDVRLVGLSQRFVHSIFSIYRHRTEIRMTFWNPMITLVQKHTIFIRKKKSIQKFDLKWPGVDLHEVWLQNDLDLWIPRAKVTINHVPHARKEFLILVNFRDHSWPDLEPDPYL